MSVARLHPDPHLRATCDPVLAFDGALKLVCTNLATAMYDSDGRGFAAPQYRNEHYGQCVFVMDADWKNTGVRSPRICINPRIVLASSDMATHTESCLSIPDTPRRITRPAWIDVEWVDLDSTKVTARLTGIEAAIFQHELDHLNGILILDHPEAS